MNKEEWKKMQNDIVDNIKGVTNEARKDLRKFAGWVKENPEKAVAAATGLCTSLGFAAKGISKLSNNIQDAREAKDLKRRIWNPVAGEYLYTKKPLTGKQKLEFEQRIASGESRAEILRSMGVLDMTR